MAPAGSEITPGKHGAFSNSFYPDVKKLILKRIRINDEIGRNEVPVLSNKSYFYINYFRIIFYKLFYLCSYPNWIQIIR